jgi:hypothetical protein
MKKSRQILKLAIIFIVLLTSCKKHDKKPACDSSVTMEVVINCTGTYLKGESNANDDTTVEYLVCNYGILKNYENGDKVNVCYRNVSVCKCSDNKVVCMMLYPHDGLVVVDHVH